MMAATTATAAASANTTSLNYNRKRLLSNGSSNSNTTKPQLIPKKQHFSSNSINNEVINLDSDDDDYIFNNNNSNNKTHHNSENDIMNNNSDEIDLDDLDDYNYNNNNNNSNNIFSDISSHDLNNISTDDDHDDHNNFFQTFQFDNKDNFHSQSKNYQDLGTFSDGMNDSYDEDNDVFNYNNYHNYNDSNLTNNEDHNRDNSSNTDDENLDYETFNDQEENAIDDENLDDGNSYSEYFQKNHSKNVTRHLSFTNPINNLVNRFLKKSNLSTSINKNVLSPPKSKKTKLRTKSLPQLAYAKLTYSPALDVDEVNMKIGDIKASLINHHNPNYTYKQKSNNKRYNNLRKFSFNQGNKSSTSSKPSFSSTSNSSATSSYDEKYLNNSNKEIIFNTNINNNNNNINNENEEDNNYDDEDGYYIVKNGAPFANGRFIIKKLLGQGTFGKVVKAYDNESKTHVAIKIIKSIKKYREASKIELRVLTMLKKHDPINKFQCIHLRECFDYRNHICIVTDLLKISLYDFMDKNQFLPFPGSHIQAMSKQLLRSVAFLHDLNLIHTDLKPENILIKDSSYIKKPYQKLNDETNNNNNSNNNEKILLRKILKDPKIYTIDFGSAIFEDEYHSSIISTRHYRAPEIILGIGWSFPCDIWSVGSILIELLTGDALFKTHENEQHLAMMEKVIGKPVDLKMVRQCIMLYKNNNKNNSSNRFDSSIVNAFSKKSGKLEFPKSSTEKKLIQEVEQLKSIEDLVEEKIGFKFNLSMSIKDSISFFNIESNQKDNYIFWYYYIDLVKKMLVFNPDDRITAREALNHKWFQLGILDDGI
ncbi:dual specificity protein kinase kns1 [Pichia californica]|uniref:Dual specificity protein kinase kns1 n=1 Tax=Pichia californica TaxID=460514 RepID=A0A9P6WHN0_9ASCO|nr:dual specificity protein kinase kns1 [[Candida] californica]